MVTTCQRIGAFALRIPIRPKLSWFPDEQPRIIGLKMLPHVLLNGLMAFPCSLVLVMIAPAIKCCDLQEFVALCALISMRNRADVERIRRHKGIVNDRNNPVFLGDRWHGHEIGDYQEADWMAIPGSKIFVYRHGLFDVARIVVSTKVMGHPETVQVGSQANGMFGRRCLLLRQYGLRFLRMMLMR